ncbi:MAG: hypothetical protein KGQ36_03805 [Rickettsiales bacterium]|nr:hypothetical protein [Rickettsiales bacterium]
MTKPDSSSQQVINIHPAAPAAAAEDKKKKWPWAFTDLESEAEFYSKEEEEEIKKRLLQKIADAYKAANPNQDNTNLYNETTKKFLPEVALAVKKEFKDKAKQPVESLGSTATDIAGVKSATASDDSIGNALIGALSGNFGGSNKQAAKTLANGLVVIKYDDIREFEQNLASTVDQRDNIRNMIALNDKNFTALTSVVELAPPGGPVSYKVVISDRAGVKVHEISKETYDNLVNDGKYAKGAPDLTDAQKLSNRERLVNKIFNEIDKPRTAIDKGMKRFLLDQCQNEKLFGIIPIPGIFGGRRDRLKSSMKELAFTFSDKDGVVVEQSRANPNRYAVTINGNPKGDTFISIGHDCHVKINSDGKVIPDTIYKLEKNGIRTEIDISGGIFRLPLGFSGPLVNSFLSDSQDNYKIARRKASEVMNRFKNLDLIVCKNGDKKCGNLGMSFQSLGKTHGLRLTDGEKIATTIAATGLTIALGAATAGATTVAAVGVAATATALSGASSAKGFADIVRDDSFEKVGVNIADKFSPNRV